MDMVKWFKEAKFGLMIHWGLYSLLAGEYKGQRMAEIGEWIQSKFHIPKAEYEKLATAFNPIYFNAEEWVLAAKNAGMNYIVITSKHHDGFALFKSEVDPYNVVDATPFGRDVIAELAEACRKHGMKLGLYYSQDFDWHEPNGGGYNTHYENYMSLSNEWDFPENDKKNYSQYFRAKVIPQVKEILTKYGDLCLIWFDTPSTLSKAESLELYELVKSIQPNCLINSRIGNGVGDYDSCGDNEIPESIVPRPTEAPVTLNHTWGYKSYDEDYKSADEVLEIKRRCNEHGANLLLNIGPDALGRLPAPALDVLKELAKRR